LLQFTAGAPSSADGSADYFSSGEAGERGQGLHFVKWCRQAVGFTEASVNDARKLPRQFIVSRQRDLQFLMHKVATV
jgi:hypothetical protein